MTPTPDAMSPVSRTALPVVLVRAHESTRPEPLFTDPYAARFAEAAGLPAELPERARREGLAAALAVHIVLRTRYYDDRLLAAGTEQVVLLAAGLDARAYRLDWPGGTRLWELDLPPVLEFKEQVLDAADAVPSCRREVLPGDLLDPGWPRRLVAAGFDPQLPTAWLAEGLLVYLSAEQAAGLLTAVGSLSAPGSRLLMERGRDVSRGPEDPALAHVTELWQGGLGPETDQWLNAHGWQARTTSLAEVGAAYGRPLPEGAGRTSGFIEAVRTAEG
ncbi:SAM-dependent methyltransferase [Kitasatospora sp. NPDC098652]|uniref:SAM-dependent methyltransferase n=1 Tax=Kitasatospora sp. NPDC098652 TaxID=3364095 RepID=UPI00381A6566